MPTRPLSSAPMADEEKIGAFGQPSVGGLVSRFSRLAIGKASITVSSKPTSAVPHRGSSFRLSTVAESFPMLTVIRVRDVGVKSTTSVMNFWLKSQSFAKRRLRQEPPKSYARRTASDIGIISGDLELGKPTSTNAAVSASVAMSIK